MSAEHSDEALPPNYKDFPDGSLLRVVFHNFLTYEHTSFVPTATLNMILGHNGSGKSSIICGICLACGGSPKSLGRSEKIIEYIRHGCTEGYVEVAIADKEKGPQTVRLTIRIGKAPEYKLNDAHATQSDINELRKHYNIQIDNPCAFLAQDKVKSFSEQSSIELLKNTEKAASDDLDRRHKDLMEQRVDSMKIEEMCTTTEASVKHLENSRTKLMPLVENYRKKVALQSKLRLLEKKMACMEFEHADEEYMFEVERVDKALEEYRRLEREIKDCEDEKRKLEDRIRKESHEITQLSNSVEVIQTAIQNNSDKKMLENMMDRAKLKLERAKSQADEHAKEIEKARRSIDTVMNKLEEAVEALAGYDDAFAESKIAETQFLKIEKENRVEEDAIQRMSYDLRCLEKKKDEDKHITSQVKTNRWRALQEMSPDVAKAWHWYHSNKTQFKGEVFTPIMDMVLKFPDAGKALENTVSVRDRSMLVCQNRDDELLINGKQHTWRINTAVVTPDTIHSNDLNAKLPQELERLGFKFLVSSCFDAPDTLKQYLCNVAGLNKIPYGNVDERNLTSVSQTLKRLRFSVFLANGLRFQNGGSLYTTKSISTQSTMREARTFQEQFFKKSIYAKKADDDTVQEYQAMKSEVESRAQELRERRHNVQKDRDMVRKSQLEWKSKKELENKYKMRLTTEKQRLQNLERETFDISKAQEEYENVEQTVMEKARATLVKNLEDQRQCIKKYRELGRCAVIEAVCKSKANKLTMKAQEGREKLVDLKQGKEAAEDELKTAFNRRKVARTSLKTECGLEHLDEAKMEPGDKKLYAKLMKLFEDSNVPTELAPLYNAITSERTRLKLAQDSGEDGSAEHEHQLIQLNADLAKTTANFEKLLENRKSIHERLATQIQEWREEVEKMIELINENYIKFFEVLGCRGEVSLETPDNPLDIERYGIMIMVCFRRGEIMKRLDNRVQSGGERSVATMLYLLALQQLCPVPFRCIDEINQGMDPTNERKVFDIMVGLWNGTSGSLTKTQYFLLSPKLLHGLDMRDNVNIVMVNSTLNSTHGQLYNSSSKIHKTLAALGIAG